MLGFIRLISPQFWSETQHFEGQIILFDPFNPTYRDGELRLLTPIPVIGLQAIEGVDDCLLILERLRVLSSPLDGV